MFLKYQGSTFAFAGSAYFNAVKIDKRHHHVRCTFGPINLAIGEYSFDIFVCVPGVRWLEKHHDIITFEINKQLGSNGFQLDAHRHIGYVILPQHWEVTENRLSSVE